MSGPEQPLLYVEWMDSSYSSGWTFPENVDSLIRPCRSVGWLLKEDESTLVLIGHHGGEGQIAAVMVIPQSAVIKRWTLTF